MRDGRAQPPSEGEVFERDGVICKVIGDYFAPVIPNDNKDLVAVILQDLHTSALGGHLGKRKLLA